MSEQEGQQQAQRPQRRGPMVDLDPSGQVNQREPDRQQRQFLNYAFYKLDPAFRRLPQGERADARQELVDAVRPWEQRNDFILRTYSLVGLRGDVDFMLWRISQDPLCFQEMQAAMNRTVIGGYLEQPYNLVSLQKRSQYVNRVEGSGEGLELLPGQGRYLFVYPFVKTRAWYALTPHARQGMMDEHIYASTPFKGVRLNTSYSYGIDDQEFVVAFDSDYPQEFVDLVGRLRYTEASLYTQRDTPMFTCAKADIAEIAEQIG
ncbi:MAG: chlorite dismutase family protein [Dehalococcoidia bacterium]|nr:chlorite dismutase family protein [Dehalococcoidia bacterium]